MDSSLKMKTVHILHYTFLGCLAVMPFASIFWEESIFFIKVNWILYPIFILGVTIFVLVRAKLNQPFIVFSIVAFFYLVLFQLRAGEMESYGRIMVSVVPFLLLPFFNEQKSATTRTFFILYVIFLMPSFFLAYLQHTGRLPYNEFDYVDGQMIGRLSGGYSKPMNFIAFLTPLYILGIYLILIKKKWLLGSILSVAILTLVVITGHRTSLIAFLIIVAMIFFKKAVYVFIFNYYKYYLNFIIGVLSFLFFYLLKMQNGLVDAIRGRIAMWQAHAQEFFQSDLFSMLFGKHKVRLPEYYTGNPLVVRLDEVHNNSFRTILLFGLVGYFIYCLFVRWIVLSSFQVQPDPDKRFIIFASFIYFILYSITNEPFYYASVVWPILVWIFLLRKDEAK